MRRAGSMRKIINYLVLGLFGTIIALCLLLAYRYIDPQSSVTLIISNLLFITLFFQLNGSLTLKSILLTACNLLGLFSNYLFKYISDAGYAIFGSTFHNFYALIFPLLTLMWIVPFWSLSLSFLPKLPNVTENPS
jgi:hypothetical protein